MKTGVCLKYLENDCREGEGQIFIVIDRLVYYQGIQNIKINSLLVVTLVTVAHFLAVLTKKSKKQQKSRKITKNFFREFLLIKKHLFIGNCYKK